MTVSIAKKVAPTTTAQGGQIGTVTPPPKEGNKEPSNQINTSKWNAPQDCFFIGNGVTYPERMSEQAKDKCRADPAYLASYLDMQDKLEAGATANSFKTSTLPHLKPLAEWFNKRKDRAIDTAQWGEPSPEFMVWPGICYHLGPNPQPGKLSIDRIDPTKPYVHGNLRWASKATQAENQRRNRKNALNDIAITDAQLSAELAKLGILSASGKPHSPASIKQTRYRIKTTQNEAKQAKFPTPDTIHAELLKRLKVPAHVPPSGDPIRDEPFMQGLGIDWEKEKQKAPWMPNISFQIEHTTSLEKQVLGEIAYFQKVNPKHVALEELNTRLTAVRDFARQLKNRLQQLHEKKAWKLCDTINPYATSTPPVPSGFGNYKPAPPPPPPLPLWADPKLKISSISDLEDWRAKAEAGEKTAYFRAKPPCSQWFTGLALIQMEKEHEELMQVAGDDEVAATMKELGI